MYLGYPPSQGWAPGLDPRRGVTQPVGQMNCRAAVSLLRSFGRCIKLIVNTSGSIYKLND